MRDQGFRWLLLPHPASATAVALATLSTQTGEGVIGKGVRIARHSRESGNPGSWSEIHAFAAITESD